MKSSLPNSTRTEFSARLIQALENARCKPAPTVVAREFNLRSGDATVTTHAARKWLIGESIPAQANLHILARWLNISPQWLRFGEGSNDFKADNSTGLSHDEVVLLGDFRRLGPSSQAVARDMVASLLRNHPAGVTQA